MEFKNLNKTVFTKKMLWECIAGIVACSCSDIIFTIWLRWFGNRLVWWSNLLESRKILLWILVFALSWLGWRGIMSIWRARTISPVLIPFSIVAIWFIVKWPGYYLNIVGGFSFEHLLVGLIVGCYIARGVKILYTKRRFQGQASQENDTSEQGVFVGHPEYFEDGRKRFAATLASLIVNTNIKKRGATFGITGEWGAGKTLVLMELKSILEKGMDVIEFSPWQSSSPENLIEDFFQTLASRLHSHSRSLGRNLENYADKLIELDIDKRLNFLAKIGRWITGGYLSINDARSRIEHDLDALPKGIIVIIDDLDRLDKDELFETLRLVRNTAHFRNIAYVIAYDPVYTTKMLERKGIENAAEYLYKIFMLSIALPSYEHYTYVGVIRIIIRQQFGEGSDDFSLLEGLISLQERNYTDFFLSRFINNYRQAVQFGQFLNANYLILKGLNPNFKVDFNLEDWYYLQILRFFFPEAYDRLQRRPEDFFNKQLIQTHDLYKFDQEIFKNSGMELPEQAVKIISMLFSDLPSSVTPTGIALMRNFYNYFAYRVLSTEVGEKEFMDMLNSVRPTSTMLTEWMHRKPRVWRSVDARFANHNIGNLTNEQIRTFVWAILWWYAIAKSPRCLRAVNGITYHSATSVQLDIAAESYYKTIHAIIGNPAIDAEIIAKLIVAQLPYPEDPTLSPDDEEDSAVTLIEEKQAEEMFEKLIERELAQGRIKSPDDISDRNSILYKLMDAAHRSTQISSGDDDVYRNYALEPVRKIIGAHINKHPEFKGSDLIRLRTTFGYSSTGDWEVDNDNEESSNRLICSFFENHPNIKTIIFEWFKGSKEDKKRTVEALHLR